MHHQGDHRRVCTRKHAVATAIPTASANVTAVGGLGDFSAAPTVKMIQVPQHHAARIGQQGSLIGVKQTDPGMKHFKNAFLLEERWQVFAIER